MIAAGILSVGTDVFAADINTEQEYFDALYGNDATLTVKQSLTITPRDFFKTWADPGEVPRPMFTLEGEYSGSGAPSVVITSNRSALGHALRTGSDGVYPSPVVDAIRNLTFTGFSTTWGNMENDSSVMEIGMLQNGLHNVHFIDNESDWTGVADFGELDGGMHDVHVVNNRSLFGAIFEINTLTGGIHNARFVGNRAMDAALEVVDELQGGLNNSVFIDNRAQLPSDFPTLNDAFSGALASATLLQNNVELANNVFLANTSNLTNAQNPTLGERGAAVLHNTGDVSGASAVAIAAETGKRTLFYGNTHNAGSGPAPSAIHFESMFDYDVGDMPPHAGNLMTVNVAMNANSGGKILMLDPISSQPDDLPDVVVNNPAPITYRGITYEADDAYEVKYSDLTVNLEKTGAGDWYLGGVSNMAGASTWDINQGTLTLTTVNYGGSLGTQAAGINLSHGTTAAFNLASGATLAGSGSITAKQIDLQGTIRPESWGNVGTLAANIANNISAADIAAIDVAKTSDYGTLAFTGDVKMTGAKYTANVGSTGKNLLDITGALTLDGNANELTLRLSSDADASNAAVISATGGITGSFDPSNVFVTAPAFLDTSGMTASATQVGNDIVVNTSGASLNWNASGANTFTLNAATPVFSINQNLTGTASLTTGGAGTTLFLNGVNDYTGDTTVTADTTLRVGETAGSAASVASKVEVAAGAVVGGHGTFAGGLVLNSGAIVSPGASIGDMTVVGNIGAPGTIYEFEINPDGTADHLIVNGSIDLAGSTLKVLHGGGNGTFGLSTTYTGIITASGGVTGPFGTIDNTLPLMDVTVNYNPNSVDLDVTRNTVAFASIGASGNQVQVGQALDALGSHAVANAVAQLSAPGIRAALDNLSGEIYASTRAALLGNRHLQNAVKQRMQATGSQPLWVSTWGYNGHLSGNANAAKVDTRGLGLALGGDWQVGSLTAGVVLGVEDGRVKGAARSRSDVDAYSAGAYLAGDVGSVQVRGGVLASYLDVDARRDITVPGLQGVAKADYKGHKTRVFAEVSKAFGLSSLSVTPYAGVSQNWLHTQATRETGHAAALDVAGQTDHVTQSTLGLRLAYQFPTAAPVALTFDAAWMRSFGDTDSHSINRFAGQSDQFDVQGVDVGKNTALIGAGVQAQLGTNATLNLGYQGQFGSNVRNHSAGVRVNVKF